MFNSNRKNIIEKYSELISNDECIRLHSFEESCEKFYPYEIAETTAKNGFVEMFYLSKEKQEQVEYARCNPQDYGIDFNPELFIQTHKANGLVETYRLTKEQRKLVQKVREKSLIKTQ